MGSKIRYLLLVFCIPIAWTASGQDDTVKVIGTLFAKKMVDAAAQQGAKDQVLVSDSLGFLYFKDSGINYPVPIEVDSIEQLDSLMHKTGFMVMVKNNGSFISDGDKWLRVSCNFKLSNVKQLRKLKRQPCPVFVQSYFDSLHYGGGSFHWVGYDLLGNGDDRVMCLVDDLCLSPQCGFSSTHHGNALSQDDQWRKLERVVEVARRVIFQVTGRFSDDDGLPTIH